MALATYEAPLLSPPGARPVRVSGPGAVVGPYRLEAVVGRGGMGVVYRAEHALLRQTRALKLLSRTVYREDPLAAERFWREARLAARIRDPHVVSVCDAGAADDGRPYLATDLIDGRQLLAMLGRGALAPGEAVTFGRQVARALAAVHAAGVVHRDVTPRNVLVTADGVVKLIDFGVAIANDDDAALDGPPGQVIGTPAYMSPEQATARPCDARSDLYQLGIMLHQMLSGSLPFWCECPEELMRHQVHTLAPTVGSPHDVLPKALVAVVASLLEKRPPDRIQTAIEVDAELERVELQLARPAWRRLMSR